MLGYFCNNFGFVIELKRGMNWYIFLVLIV